jgi:exonuclease VII small subunit
MVLLAFLAGLVLVIAATAVCVVRGVRLWRQLKRTGRAIRAELSTFEARTARTETLLAQAERRGSELEAALERLRVSRARFQVLRDALESAQARVRWLRAFLPV